MMLFQNRKQHHDDNTQVSSLNTSFTDEMSVEGNPRLNEDELEYHSTQSEDNENDSEPEKLDSPTLDNSEKNRRIRSLRTEEMQNNPEHIDFELNTSRRSTFEPFRPVIQEWANKWQPHATSSRKPSSRDGENS